MMRENKFLKRQRIFKLIRKLKKTYPEARCALTFSNPFELLVATILSAQCTDKRVNLVTPVLFKKYRTVDDYATAETKEVEAIIRSTGFYQNKAKNIIGSAQKILEDYQGKVPTEMEDLITLSGVGRKTANVILGNAFGIPGLTVDTHMIRINRLLGLTGHKDPVKIEYDLMEIVPQKYWTLYSHWIIHHGRARCVARRPDCPQCEIAHLCPSAGKFSKK